MPHSALAQSVGAAQPAANDRPPRLLIESSVGLARFVDDAPIAFAYVGGSGRAYLSRRVALGPEFVYMNGPDGSRQWHLTGVLTVDLVEGRRSGQWSRVVPYVVAAAGYQRMTNPVGTGMFTSSEGSVSGGVGARVGLNQRSSVFIAPEFRFGWEPHYRFGATFGVRY